MADGLEHVTVQLIDISRHGKQIGQCHYLMPILLAEEHVEAGVLAPTETKTVNES